ncbi:hypothetical protein ATI61_105479 [Archangium gephyra]|uniref:Uncharacterized protein n=1 Tax=Archangium gephyra TaxID=48 RepID=A0AAC8QFK4_9BACT|nr:hypothetical protein [Archangium gephyra]AKJ06535.1 Hypothetical protein AA314_08161 [Archangium gephyra]REG32151.1 hypothetical protein ATI61_105479 [Archangium gephyra]
MRTARHSKQQRGAASVEAAISMLIIIPAFMYALFLDDLLRYAADLQEAVVSTPWDFAGQNYTQPNSRGLKGGASATKPTGGNLEVQHQARLMYCDHESSGDSYKGDSSYVNDCDGEDHHQGKALSGHVCWLNDSDGDGDGNPDAHQVTCEPVQRNVGLLGSDMYSDYHNQFGRAGGMYECHGQEVVENYLLPKSFLQEFAGDEKMSKENWSNDGSSIHENAKKGDKDTAYYLAEQRFALVADSWAVNETPANGGEGESAIDMAVAPGTKSGPLYERVSLVYTGNASYTLFQTATTTFLTAASKKLLNPIILTSRPDNPATPNVSLTKVGTSPPKQNIEQDNGSHDYYSTPWKDWSNNPYEKTYGKRGKYYMGCKTAQKDKC